MNRWTTLVACTCMLGLLSAPCALAANPEFTFKLQSYYSPSNMQHIKQFAQDIETNSKGRIAVTVFAAGELVSTNNILKALKSGMIDLAVISGYYYTDLELGDIEAGLPMGWLTAKEAEEVYFKDGLVKLVAEGYTKHGAHYLGPMWAATYQLLTKNPVNSLEDLRKIKLRSSGTPAKMLQNLNIATVSMVPEEIYLGLSTGQIDGVLYGAPFEYVLTKFYEQAPYLVQPPVLDPITDAVLINANMWKKLPADLKAVLEKATEDLRWAYYNYGQELDKKALATEFKGKTTQFSDKDVAEMTKAATVVWDEEATKSPIRKQAIELIKKAAQRAGRL